MIRASSHVLDENESYAKTLAQSSYRGIAGVEVAVSGAAAGREEVDDAHPPLAGSLEPLHDSVTGTNACPGENRIMRAQNLSTWLGEGRDVAPSLALADQSRSGNL
jgi:hypothetical protein